MARLAELRVRAVLACNSGTAAMQGVAPSVRACDHTSYAAQHPGAALPCNQVKKNLGQLMCWPPPLTAACGVVGADAKALYARVARMDLAQNVFRNGQWGRHLCAPGPAAAGLQSLVCWVVLSQEVWSSGRSLLACITQAPWPPPVRACPSVEQTAHVRTAAARH
jgi:hypothetical protein